jgi:hypothetical protein
VRSTDLKLLNPDASASLPFGLNQNFGGANSAARGQRREASSLGFLPAPAGTAQLAVNRSLDVSQPEKASSLSRSVDFALACGSDSVLATAARVATYLR